MNILETVGGRRWILVMAIGLAASVLVWNAKISESVYRDIILGTAGVYIMANTYQKVKGGAGR